MLIMLSVLSCGFGLQAQSGLKIKKIFDDYANGKGVVMVQLINESMNSFDFALYKSITIKNNTAVIEKLQKCLEEDQIQADKVKKVESGTEKESKNTTFLVLPKRNNLYRLILYKYENIYKSDQTAILIYIETKSKPDDMMNFILKKK